MRARIFTALLAVAVVVLLFVLFKEKGKNKEKDSGITPIAKEAVRLEVESVTKKIDREGFEHAVISDKVNVIRHVSELDTSARKELDSVMRLLAIERKQLKEWKQYGISVKAKLDAVKTDTSFRYSDKWANIEYVKPKDTISGGHFNFSYNAEINYAEYWRRKWFLAPKRHYIDFWISDPRATINSVKRVKFEVKEPFVKVDVNAGAYYTDQLNVGFDGGVHLGRSRIGGGYYYNVATGDWRPVATYKFRLIEF